MTRSVLSFFALVVMSANCVGNSLKNASGYRVVKTDETTIAQTIYGPVQGYLDGDVFTFKGIPYAQAERFMPPTAPEKHDNVVKCRLYGPKAPQTESLEWQGINQTDYAFGNQFVYEPEGRASLSICFGMDEKGHNGYTANIGGWTGDMVTLQPMTNGRPGDFIGKPGNIKMNPAQWYDVELVITPEMTRFFIDGKEMVAGAPPIPTRQFCQAGYDELTGELVIKVVNGTEKSYKRCFDIAGANNVMPTGKVITLCGDAEDENTFEQPTKIAPQTSLYGKFGKQFSYEFAPMSFTIMRIKVAK